MAYNVQITNGTGTEEILNGTYSVTTNVAGYDNSSITPSTVTVEAGVNEYSFAVAATGTLTVHVSETGVAGGVPIVGATFIRTNEIGQEYGNAVTSNSEGNAIFENVPFGADGAPLIYFKQTASDGSHEFVTDVLSTTLLQQTGIYEVQNAVAALRTFLYTDANYDGLGVTGQINLG